MTRLPIIILFAVALAGLVGSHAGAVTTSTATIACSGMVKLQKAIDAVPAGTIGTLVVSGTCAENLLVPAGKTVIIKGKSRAARLVPQDAKQPVLVSNGYTTLQAITVSNPGGAADSLVEANDGGHLDIIGSDLSAPKAYGVVEIYQSAGGRVINSRITAGQGVGLEASDASSLGVIGSPAFPSGPDGARVVVTGSQLAAVTCNNGASLSVRARSAKGANGSVLVTRSKIGFDLSQCSSTIVNKTSVQSGITISGLAADGVAISTTDGSNTFIRNIAIQGNAGRGLSVRGASLTVTTATIRNNAQGDLWLDYAAIATLPGWNGPSSIPGAFSAATIGCYQTEGSVPPARLLVDVGGVALPPGKSLDDLVARNSPCVAVR